MSDDIIQKFREKFTKKKSTEQNEDTPTAPEQKKENENPLPDNLLNLPKENTSVEGRVSHFKKNNFYSKVLFNNDNSKPKENDKKPKPEVKQVTKEENSDDLEDDLSLSEEETKKPSDKEEVEGKKTVAEIIKNPNYYFTNSSENYNTYTPKESTNERTSTNKAKMLAHLKQFETNISNNKSNSKTTNPKPSQNNTISSQSNYSTVNNEYQISTEPRKSVRELLELNEKRLKKLKEERDEYEKRNSIILQNKENWRLKMQKVAKFIKEEKDTEETNEEFYEDNKDALRNFGITNYKDFVSIQELIALYEKGNIPQEPTGRNTYAGYRSKGALSLDEVSEEVSLNLAPVKKDFQMNNERMTYSGVTKNYNKTNQILLGDHITLGKKDKLMIIDKVNDNAFINEKKKVKPNVTNETSFTYNRMYNIKTYKNLKSEGKENVAIKGKKNVSQKEKDNNISMTYEGQKIVTPKERESVTSLTCEGRKTVTPKEKDNNISMTYEGKKIVTPKERETVASLTCEAKKNNVVKELDNNISMTYEGQKTIIPKEKENAISLVCKGKPRDTRKEKENNISLTYEGKVPNEVCSNVDLELKRQEKPALKAYKNDIDYDNKVCSFSYKGDDSKKRENSIMFDKSDSMSIQGKIPKKRYNEKTDPILISKPSNVVVNGQPKPSKINISKTQNEEFPSNKKFVYDSPILSKEIDMKFSGCKRPQDLEIISRESEGVVNIKSSFRYKDIINNEVKYDYVAPENSKVKSYSITNEESGTINPTKADDTLFFSTMKTRVAKNVNEIAFESPLSPISKKANLESINHPITFPVENRVSAPYSVVEKFKMANEQNSKYQKNIISALDSMTVLQYQITNPHLDPSFLDVLCINCYECVKLSEMDSHSQKCTIPLNQFNDNDFEEDYNTRIYKLHESLKNDKAKMSSTNNQTLTNFYNKLLNLIYEIMINNNSIEELDSSITSINEMMKTDVNLLSPNHKVYFIILTQRLSQLVYGKLKQMEKILANSDEEEEEDIKDENEEYNTYVNQQDDDQVRSLKMQLTSLENKTEKAKTELQHWKKEAKILESTLRRPNSKNQGERLSEIVSDVNSKNESVDMMTTFSGQVSEIGNEDANNYEDMENWNEDEKKKCFLGIGLSIKFKYTDEIKDEVSIDELFQKANKMGVKPNEYYGFILSELGLKK